jgi:hypothetical protein
VFPINNRFTTHRIPISRAINGIPRIDLFGFVMGTQCIFYTVEIEFLNTISTNNIERDIVGDIPSRWPGKSVLNMEVIQDLNCAH